MTALNWIATRTQQDCAFHPAGIDSAHTAEPAGPEFLPRGSVFLETETRSTSHPVYLLRFGVLEPWPSGLTICLEPDGTLRLSMRQGARAFEAVLKTGLGGEATTVQIAYVWDAPRRCGRLSAYTPDHGQLWQTTVTAPFPLALRDAQLMTQSGPHAVIDEGLEFLAIADAPCPLGPMPGLAGSAAVDTPEGPRALRNVRAGDFVTAEGRGPVRVLWSGHATVPALGRFAPMTLRQPYLGLWDDLVAAGGQRVCLAGSEVEYLFGEERVTTDLRNLGIRNCVRPTKNAPNVVCYHQLLLESHEIITVNGALVESFNGAALFETDGALGASVLGEMEPAYRPRQAGLAAPVLKGFEALTLTGVSIG